MVYCNQRNNNDDDDKFLILFTIDRVVNLPKRGLQSILYLLICCYFHFLQTDSWISAMLQGRLWFRWEKGLFRKTNVFLQECCESELRLICQNQGLKDKQMIFCDFVGQFKIMFKVVKKNRKKYACSNFFITGSVSNICSNASNFPAKKLRKIRCSKYTCAVFFFFLNKITTFHLLSSCIIITKIHQ